MGFPIQITTDSWALEPHKRYYFSITNKQIVFSKKKKRGDHLVCTHQYLLVKKDVLYPWDTVGDFVYLNKTIISKEEYDKITYHRYFINKMEDELND